MQDKAKHASPHLREQSFVCTSFLMETACLQVVPSARQSRHQGVRDPQITALAARDT